MISDGRIRERGGPHSSTGWTRVFVGLGSNLGRRDLHLQAAVHFLSRAPGIHLQRLSRVYETRPVGPVAQGAFLNAVAELLTALSPRDLLERLLSHERTAGRVRTVRWGPRTIDLDILLYGNAEVDEPGLRIPHPELAHRAFVLVPLAELAPGLEVPGIGATVAALRDQRPDLADVVPAPDVFLAWADRKR